MSDSSAPRPASPARRTAAKAAQAGFSLVWLVPILALAVTLGLAWNAYSGRGEVISVEFSDATGIVPGETSLRFREVTVGEVESVSFTDDLRNVLVNIRVEPEVVEYIDTEAEFWIVRPIVSAQGISRLDTVLSGVFIEGFWDSDAGEKETNFVGLNQPTLARLASEGTWFVLSSAGAKGLAEGAPVTFRGLEVGRMQNLRLSEEDESVLADVFIEAPHDKRLTSASVFWDTSGFSVSLGAQGLSLDVASLSQVVQGGVAFSTMAAGGQPIEAGHLFRLQPDEEAARASLFGSAEDDIRLSMLVDNDLNGLTTDSDVEYEGLAVGRVTELGVDIDENRPEGEEVKQRITFVVAPSRLGLEPGATQEEALRFFEDRVAGGLRARVSSSGFLGISKVIDLVDQPMSAPAALDVAAEPYPIIPSIAPEVSDLGASAEGLFTRLGGLNLEGLLQSATNMMDAITQVAASPDTQAIPKALRTALDDTQAAAADIQAMTSELREANAAANLSRALDEAAQAAEAVRLAAANVPEMVTQMEGAAAAIEEFGFAEISTEAEGVLADLRQVVGTEEARQLPADLAATLEAASSVLEDLREGEAAANLSRALDEAAQAAEAVRLAAVDVPEMVDQIDEAAAAVEEFGFEEISAQAEGILADIRAMLGTEDAEQLPRNLSDTLEAASGLLNDLRDGNAAGSLNEALDSARVAADEVAEAAQTLPELSERFQRLAARAEVVIAAYGGDSVFNQQARAMMTELGRAATAFGSLARTIERNPRAFILGR
ncbi:MlaD family protein [Paracoccus albus]|uniref:MlaD family protein n=1 Tax=Paracoccus albus TaxID=3017784 RepID=UPI0022F140A2|nr:MlaD family protein [Paracoccus albus]WBU59992.1 MlaD family protein [Paracoccus albus]